MVLQLWCHLESEPTSIDTRWKWKRTKKWRIGRDWKTVPTNVHKIFCFCFSNNIWLSAKEYRNADRNCISSKQIQSLTLNVPLSNTNAKKDSRRLNMQYSSTLRLCAFANISKGQIIWIQAANLNANENICHAKARESKGKLSIAPNFHGMRYELFWAFVRANEWTKKQRKKTKNA